MFAYAYKRILEVAQMIKEYQLSSKTIYILKVGNVFHVQLLLLLISVGRSVTPGSSALRMTNVNSLLSCHSLSAYQKTLELWDNRRLLVPAKLRYRIARNEPPRGKTKNVVFEQVRRKPGCTRTEDG